MKQKPSEAGLRALMDEENFTLIFQHPAKPFSSGRLNRCSWKSQQPSISHYFCCWKCYGKWRKLLWLGHAMLAWKSLSILFSLSTQKIKTSEQIYWGFSSLLVTLDSKSVTGWRLVLLFGEEQLSLATLPCLISGTGDLLVDHCWEIQLYRHHLQGCSRKGLNTGKVAPAAMGHWQQKSNCPPLKAAPVTAMSQKSTFTWISARSNNSLGVLDMC